MFLVDIVVSRSTIPDHLETIFKVLNILENNSLLFNNNICDFFKDQIEYLGHVASKRAFFQRHLN